MHVSLSALLLGFYSNRACVLRVAQPLVAAWQGDTVLSGGNGVPPPPQSGNVPNEGLYGGGSALDAATSMQRRSSPASWADHTRTERVARFSCGAALGWCQRAGRIRCADCASSGRAGPRYNGSERGSTRTERGSGRARYDLATAA